MSKVASFAGRAITTIVCLGFTGTGVIRAEPAQAPELRAIDPFDPHHPVGPTARLGTAVGYVYDNPLDVLALGGTIAVGHRFDRITVEAEYGYLTFQSHGSLPMDLGHAHRLGANARLEVVRLGPERVGKHSMVAGYIEGGLARQRNSWDLPGRTEASRAVPMDSSHSEGTIGIGILIDHRVQQPRGFPNRIGWLFGWRAVAAPHDPVPMAFCRGAACSPAPMQLPERKVYETALLFTSSLAFTW